MADTFTCHWINRLDQFGFTNMDIIVDHDQGVIPSARFSRNWHIDPELVDSDFLEAEALLIVDQVIADWNAINEEV